MTAGPAAAPRRAALACALAAAAAAPACSYDSLDTAAALAAIVGAVAQPRDELPDDALLTVEVIGDGPGDGSRLAEGSVRVRTRSGDSARTVAAGSRETLRFAPGTELALLRVNGNPGVISFWDGDCRDANSNECRLEARGDMRVTARFVVPRAAFSVASRGEAVGTLLVSHAGESAAVSDGDVAVFSPNAPVRLRAELGPGTRAAWSGACAAATGNLSSASECALFAEDAVDIGVEFVRVRPLSFSMSLEHAEVKSHAVVVTRRFASADGAGATQRWRLRAGGASLVDGPGALAGPGFSAPAAEVYRLDWPVDVGDRLEFGVELTPATGTAVNVDFDTWGGACGGFARTEPCAFDVGDPDPPDAAPRALEASSAIGRVRNMTVRVFHADSPLRTGDVRLEGAGSLRECAGRGGAGTSQAGCTARPTVGSTVRLTAVDPPGGSDSLARWEWAPPDAPVDCAPALPCVLRMPDLALEITAVFAEFVETAVEVVGAAGSVRRGAERVTASGRFLSVAGEAVTLVAQPAADTVFLSWGGECARFGRQRICEFTADAAAAGGVSANFALAATLSVRDRSPGGVFAARVEDAEGPYPLELAVGPNRVAAGATVTVTARGAAGERPTVFARWGLGSICAGAADPTDAVCGPFAAADADVDGQFAAARWLDVSAEAEAVAGAGAPLTGDVRVGRLFAGGAVRRETTLAGGAASASTRVAVAIPAQVSLSAAPDGANAIFEAWGRDFDCEGSPGLDDPECRFLMPDRDVSVAARYVSAAPPIELGFAGDGAVRAAVSRPRSERVHSSAGGPAAIRSAFGASVELSAVAGADSVFVGWSGCPEERGATCGILADAEHAVTAAFVASARLDLSVVGPGGEVRIAGDPLVVPEGPYPEGSHSIPARPGRPLALSARPTDALALFSGWTGCAAADAGECAVTAPAAGQALSLTARFSRDLRTVRVAVEGPGQVSLPSGAEAGELSALPGTLVELSASPQQGHVFWGWRGDVCAGSLAADCAFLPSQVPGGEVDVTAVFRRPGIDLAVFGPEGARVVASGALSGNGEHAAGETARLEASLGSAVTLRASPASALSAWELAPSDGDRGDLACAAAACALDVGDEGVGWRPLRVDAVFRTVYNVRVAAGPGGAAAWSFAPGGADSSGTAVAGSAADVAVSSEAEMSVLALALAGFEFVAWRAEGAPCAERAACAFSPRGPVELEAVFARATTVTVAAIAGANAGGVVSYPGGAPVGAGGRGTFLVAQGSTVTVTASAAPGSLFTRWEGPCPDRFAPSCTLRVDGDTALSAHFARAVTLELRSEGGAPRRAVSLSVERPGRRPADAVEETLELTPQAPSDARVLAAGATVRLTALDAGGNVNFNLGLGDSGSRFVAWTSGPCAGPPGAADPGCVASVSAGSPTLEVAASFVGMLSVNVARGAGEGSADLSWTASAAAAGERPLPTRGSLTLGPAAEASTRVLVPAGGRLALELAPLGATVFRAADAAFSGAFASGSCDAANRCELELPARPPPGAYATLLSVRLPLSLARRVSLAAQGGRGGILVEAPGPLVLDPRPGTGALPRALLAPEGSALALRAFAPQGNAAFLRWTEGACAAAARALDPVCGLVVPAADSTQTAEFVDLSPATVTVAFDDPRASEGAELAWRVSYPLEVDGGAVAVELGAGSADLSASAPAPAPVAPGAEVALTLAPGDETVLAAGGIAVSGPDGPLARLEAGCDFERPCELAFSVPADASGLEIAVTLARGHPVELRLVGAGRVDYAVEGAGAGSLESPSPRRRSFRVGRGGLLELEAAPALAGTTFSGWTSAPAVCSGAAPECSFRVSAATSVTATYGNLRELQLTPGSSVGRVDYELPGESGSWLLGQGLLSLFAAAGSVVRLEAAEDPGWEFTGWVSTACAEPASAVCEVTVEEADIVVGAEFQVVPTLRLGFFGAGSGSFSYSVADAEGMALAAGAGELDASGPSSATVRAPVGSQVSLSAPVAGAGAFLGWVSSAPPAGAADPEAGPVAVPPCLAPPPDAADAACGFTLGQGLVAAVGDELLVQAWFARTASVTFGELGAGTLRSGAWRYADPRLSTQAAAFAAGEALGVAAGEALAVELTPQATSLAFGVRREGGADNLCPPPPGLGRGQPLSCELVAEPGANAYLVDIAEAFELALGARGADQDPGSGSLGYAVSGGEACDDEDGSGECLGALSVRADATVTVTASPDAGSRLERWAWDSDSGQPNPCAARQPACAVTGLSGNASLRALFSLSLDRVIVLAVDWIGGVMAIESVPAGGVGYRLSGAGEVALLEADATVEEPELSASVLRSVTVEQGETIELFFTPSSGHAYVGVSGPGAGLCAYRPVAAGERGGCAPDVAGGTETLDWSVGYLPAGEVRGLRLSVSGAGRVSYAVPGAGPAIAAGPVRGFAAVALEPRGGALELDAAADAGHEFAGWSGDCAGQPAACRLALDRDVSATASFALSARALRVAATGGGSVEVAVGGRPAEAVAAGPPREFSVDVETSATLTAMADPGYRFDGWDADGAAAACALAGAAVCKLGAGAFLADASATAVFAPVRYTLAVEAGDNGSVDVFVGGALFRTVGAGDALPVAVTVEDAVTLGARPDAGYEFDGWRMLAACASEAAVCALAAGAFLADASAAAVFVAVPRTLTVTAGANGSVAVSVGGGDPVAVAAGESTAISVSVESMVALEAAPDAGHAFVGWDADGPCAVAGAVCALGAGAFLADASATASFAPAGSVLTVAAGRGGSVEVAIGDEAPSTVAAGASVGFPVDAAATATLTAAPAPGYRFDGWDADGACALAAGAECELPPGTFSGEAAEAAFAAAPATLTVSAGAGGSVAVAVGGDPAETVAAGSSRRFSVDVETPATLTAAPEPGYGFAGWGAAGAAAACAQAGPVCALPVGTLLADASATASFAPAGQPSHGLTVLAGAGGLVAYDIAGSATNASGTIAAGGGLAFSVDAGTTATLEAMPEDGYRFVRWDASGAAAACAQAGAECELPAGALTANAVVTAVFAPVQYTLTVAAGAGGQVRVSVVGFFEISASTLSAGASKTVITDVEAFVTLTATPAAGYVFAGWEGDVCADAGAECALPDGTLLADASVEAVFEAAPPALTVTAGADGSVMVTVGGGPAETVAAGSSREFSVGAGDEVTLTATPDPGYEFSVAGGWNADGPCAGAGTVCLLLEGALLADASVEAIFVLVPYTLTVTAGDNGSVSINITGQLQEGSQVLFAGTSDVFNTEIMTEVVLQADPADHYVFAGWEGDVCASAGALCELPVGTFRANASVEAVFEAAPTTLTVTAGDNGAVAVSVGGGSTETVAAGESTEFSVSVEVSATLTARPAAGHEFAGWDLESACGRAGAVCPLPAGTFRADASATASFRQATYTLTVEAGDNGSVAVSVDGGSTATVAAGESTARSVSIEVSATLTAIPADDYVFDGWNADGPCADAEAACALDAGAFTADETATASFFPAGPVLTVTAGDNGSVRVSVVSDPDAVPVTVEAGGSRRFSVDADTVVVLVADPADGYGFDGWNLDGVCAHESMSAACTTTIGALDAGGSLEASFAPLALTLLTSSAGNGAVDVTINGVFQDTLSSGQTAGVGFTVEDTVTLEARPDPGYEFDGWSGGACDGAGPVCVITPGSSPGDPARASFALAEYTLTAAAAGNGSVAVWVGGGSTETVAADSTMDFSVDVETSATLTATPADHYEFGGWSGGACAGFGPVCPLPVGTFLAAASATAAFTPTNYILTVGTVDEAGVGGTVDVSFAESINTDITLAAYFVTIETSATLTARPADGYRFDVWDTIGPGVDACVLAADAVCALAPGTFTADATVAASFEPVPTSLRVTVDNGGSVVVDSNGVVVSTFQSGVSSSVGANVEGQQVTFTAIPADGYEFDGWLSDDCTPAAGLTCLPDDAAFDGEIVVTAFFAPVSYILTVASNSNGSVAVTVGGGSTETVAAGTLNAREFPVDVETSATLTAEPDGGYRFDIWDAEGACEAEVGDTCRLPVGAFLANASATASFAVIETVVSVNAEAGGDVEVRQGGNLQHTVFGPGSVGVSGDVDIPLTLTAVPDTGYAFDRWEGECLDTASVVCEFPAAAFDGAISVRAFFRLATYTLTVTAGTGGSVEVTLDGVVSTVDAGESEAFSVNIQTQGDLEAIEAAGHFFRAWEHSGICPTPINKVCALSAGVFSDNALATADFRVSEFTLTVSGARGGAVTAFSPAIGGAGFDVELSAGQTQSFGVTVEDAAAFTATPATGYAFSDWAATGAAAACAQAGPVCVLSTGTFTADASVEPIFAAVPTNLMVVAMLNGSVDITIDETSRMAPAGGSFSTSITIENSVTLTAVPDPGYEFDRWTGDACAGAGPHCELSADAAAFDGEITVVANFVQSVPVLAVSAQAGGSVTVAVDGGSTATASAGAPLEIRLDAGTTATLTAIAAAGYVFFGWVGDLCGGLGLQCEISLIALAIDFPAGLSITAVFRLESYELQVFAAGAGGTVLIDNGSDPVELVAPGGEATVFVNVGTSATLTAVAAAGYEFAGWDADGACADAEDRCLLPPGRFTADTSATASFEVVPTTLTVTVVGAGGEAIVESPVGDFTTVNAGMSAEFAVDVEARAFIEARELSANARFAGWDADEACAATDGEFCRIPAGTFAADETVTVAFEVIFLLSLRSEGGFGDSLVIVTVAGLDPASIGFPAFVTYTIGPEDSVTLEAAPDTGWEFSAWSADGPCAGQGATCQIPPGTLTANAVVAPPFVMSMSGLRAPRDAARGARDAEVSGAFAGGALEVGAGLGGSVLARVLAAPSGHVVSERRISAGGSAAVEAAGGARLRLRASPGPRGVFLRWTGACAGAGAECELPAAGLAGEGAAAEFLRYAWTGPGPVTAAGTTLTAHEHAPGAFVGWRPGSVCAQADPAAAVCDASGARGGEVAAAAFLPVLPGGIKALSFGLGYPAQPRRHFRISFASSAAGFVTELDGILAAGAGGPAAVSLPVSVHRFPWDRGVFLVEGCDAAGDCGSVAQSSLGQPRSADATGYFKAPRAGAGDAFGGSVSLSADGGALAVGAPGEDSARAGALHPGDPRWSAALAGDGAGDAGAAYVYRQGPAGRWRLEALVKAPRAGAGDVFGAAVSLSADGAALAVGAPGAGAADSAAVYAYRRDSAGRWRSEALVEPPGRAGDRFGASVALAADGDALAVGAPGAGAADSGAVYAYRRDSAGRWRSEALVEPPGRAGDRFGASVALAADGDALAVGAPGAGATDSGAVYAYRRDSAGRWRSEALVEPPGRAGDRFGASVALAADGDALAVGAPGEDGAAAGALHLSDAGWDAVLAAAAADAGAAYVYRRDSSGRWRSEALVKAPEANALGRFGAAVALSAAGDALAVGETRSGAAAVGVFAPLTPGWLAALSAASGLADGAVHMYHRDPASGRWRVGALVKPSGGAAGARFGAAVALSADAAALAVGADAESGPSLERPESGSRPGLPAVPASGAVYLY